MDLALTPSTTALVVIDLMNSVVARQCTPFSADQVVANAAKLAQASRAAGCFVVLVRVASRDGKDMLHPRLDTPPAPPPSPMPNGSDIVTALGPEPSDLVLTKHQWGAFYGTELDLQLRRRGIATIVLCGIATGIGVDTTAREAYQRGYNQVFALDAMSGLYEDDHRYVSERIFPRIGQSRTTEEIVAALGQVTDTPDRA